MPEIIDDLGYSPRDGEYVMTVRSAIGKEQGWALRVKRFSGVFCECLARSSKIQHHEARLLKLPADPKDLEF